MIYENAKNWMWDYCIYTGSWRNPNDKNQALDLGYWINDKKDTISFANVYGNSGGQYESGQVVFDNKLQYTMINNFIKNKYLPSIESYKLIVRDNPLNIQNIIRDYVANNECSTHFIDFHKDLFKFLVIGPLM